MKKEELAAHYEARPGWLVHLHKRWRAWRELPAGGWAGVVLFFALVDGIAMRLAAPLYAQVGSDGGNYAALGRSLTTTGTLTLPWGDVWTDGGYGPTASHHYPPLYPAWDALFFKAFGFSAESAQWAGIVSGLLAAAVAFAATWRIVGRVWAPWVAALVLWQPRLAWSAGTGFSEGLVVALFCGTLWMLWESLDRPALVLPAGILAALCYLSRSSMGPFFAIAIAGGAWWRIRSRGWRSLLNPYYVAAGIVVVATVTAWTYRNWHLFGTTASSTYNAAAWDFSLHHLDRFAYSLFTKLVLYAGLIALYLATFKPWMRQAWKVKLQERPMLLWLAVVLTAAIGCVLAAAYGAYMFDAFSTWWLDSERYLVVAYVPLLWLVLWHAPRITETTRRPDLGKPTNGAALRVALAVVISAGMAALILTDTGTFAEAGAFKGVPAGSEVGYTGPTSLYSAYVHMPEVKSYYRCNPTPSDACPGHAPDYIVAMMDLAPHPGYVEVGRGFERHAVDPPTVAVLYERSV